MPRRPRNERRISVAETVRKIPGGVRLAGLVSLLLFLVNPARTWVLLWPCSFGALDFTPARVRRGFTAS